MQRGGQFFYLCEELRAVGILVILLQLCQLLKNEVNRCKHNSRDRVVSPSSGIYIKTRAGRLLLSKDNFVENMSQSGLLKTLHANLYSKQTQRPLLRHADQTHKADTTTSHVDKTHEADISTPPLRKGKGHIKVLGRIGTES